MPEKRTNVRRLFEKTVVLERSGIISDRFQNYRYDGLILDVSQGGLSVTTDFRLREGEIVKLMIPMKDTEISVPVMAEVKWSRKLPSTCQSGLKFLS